jgi:hypothetical protein
MSSDTSSCATAGVLKSFYGHWSRGGRFFDHSPVDPPVSFRFDSEEIKVDQPASFGFSSSSGIFLG